MFYQAVEKLKFNNNSSSRFLPLRGGWNVLFQQPHIYLFLQEKGGYFLLKVILSMIDY
jgi:hypothetical protein